MMMMMTADYNFNDVAALFMYFAVMVENNR